MIVCSGNYQCVPVFKCVQYFYEPGKKCVMVNWSGQHDLNIVDWAVKIQMKKKKNYNKQTKTDNRASIPYWNSVHHSLLLTLLLGSKPKIVFKKQPCYIQRKIY